MRFSWKTAAIGAGLLGLVLFARSDTSYSYGGAPVRNGVDRDPNKLLPGFARKLETLFQRMRARGFEPMLWEGYRSPARAAQEAAQGDGIKDSIHSYRGAADIVDGRQWALGKDPWTTSTAFWNALGEEAERLGLTWGGRFSKVDKPHVQWPTVQQQVAFRAMSDAQRQQAVA